MIPHPLPISHFPCPLCPWDLCACLCRPSLPPTLDTAGRVRALAHLQREAAEAQASLHARLVCVPRTSVCVCMGKGGVTCV